MFESSKLNYKLSTTEKIAQPLLIIVFLILASADFLMTFIAFQYALPFGYIYSLILAAFVVLFFNFSLFFADLFFHSNKPVWAMSTRFVFIIVVFLNILSNIVGFSAENILDKECAEMTNKNKTTLVNECESLNRAVDTLLNQSQALLTIELRHKGGEGPFSNGIKDSIESLKSLKIECDRDKIVENELQNDKRTIENNSVGIFFNEIFQERIFSCKNFLGYKRLKETELFTRNDIKKSYSNLTIICTSEIQRFQSFSRGSSLEKTGYVEHCDQVVKEFKILSDTTIKEKNNTLKDQNVKNDDVDGLFRLFFTSFENKWPYTRFIEHIGFGLILVILHLMLELLSSTLIVNSLVIRKLWEKETRRLLKDVSDQPAYSSDTIDRILDILMRDFVSKKDFSGKNGENVSNFFKQLFSFSIIRGEYFLPERFVERFVFSYHYRHWFKDSLKDELRLIIKNKKKDESGHKFDPEIVPNTLTCLDEFLEFLETKKSLKKNQIELPYTQFISILNSYKENKDGTCTVTFKKSQEDIFFSFKDYIKPLIDQFDEECYGEDRYFLGDYFFRCFDKNNLKIIVGTEIFPFIKSAQLFEAVFKLKKSSLSAVERQFISLNETMKKQALDTEVRFETIEEVSRLLNDLSNKNLYDFYALDIARFHLEAAKSYSHTGNFKAVKEQIGFLESLVNNAVSDNLKNERAPFLLEAIRIEANAWFDLFEIEKAIGMVKESIKNYNKKDIHSLKSNSALGRFYLLKGDYKAADEILSDVERNINRSEIIQPKIHRLQGLTWSKKISQAKKEYKEINGLFSDGFKYARKDKSLEFLRVHGCEIVLMAMPTVRGKVYNELDQLPIAFKKERAMKYHNQLYSHYIYLINKSLGDESKNNGYHGFYLNICDQIKEDVASDGDKISIISLIRLGMIATYLYFLQNAKKNKKKEISEIIEKFQINVQREPSISEYEKMYRIFTKHYSIIRKEENPFEKKSVLLKFLKEIKYIIPKI